MSFTMPDGNYECASYLTKYLHPKRAKKYISWAVKVLKRLSKEYDTIAFTGLSGALMAPEIAHRLGKHLIAVRKPGANHSGRKVEGYVACKKYVVVDDFVDSGATTLRVQRAIKKFAPEAQCIGTLEVSDLGAYDLANVTLNDASWCILKDKKK